MKKERFARFILANILLFLAFALILLDSPAAHAVKVPEKLIYDLTWTGIKAGTATQEIAEDGETFRITSVARSADWISTFFPVEDRIESVVSKKEATLPGLPKAYRMKIREGKTRRDKEIVFDHGQKKANFTDHISGEKTSIDILDDTFDTYSSFYHVRFLDMEVGKSLFVSILDSKKLWKVEVQVLRKEKIKTKFGEFNTIVIRPLLKSDGIFDGKGSVDIWLTDDHRRLPVKMQTKVAVGKVTATLVGGDF